MSCVACMFLIIAVVLGGIGDSLLVPWWCKKIGVQYRSKRYLCSMIDNSSVWKSVLLLYLPKAAAWYWSSCMYTYTHIFYYWLTLNIIAFTSQILVYIRWRLSLLYTCTLRCKGRRVRAELLQIFQSLTVEFEYNIYFRYIFLQ